MPDYKTGQWIKIKDEDDHFKINDMELSTGMVTVEDMTGNKLYTSIRSIERSLTNEEVYGYKNKRSIKDLP